MSFFSKHTLQYIKYISHYYCILIINKGGNDGLENQSIEVKTDHLPSGIYFYRLMDGENVIRSGKLVSQE